MMKKRYDVLLVGAGAAGCAAAMNLPPGMDALLIDRGDPRHGRCCGGLIAADAKSALAAAGLDIPAGVRVLPEPAGVHVLDLESGREQTYRRDYWNVERARFDAWLLDLAARRAEFVPGAQFLDAEPGDGGLVARVRVDGRVERVACRYLVGADGARSAVRRLMFPGRPAVPMSLAIQVELPACEGLRMHEVLFSERLTDFYAWAVPKPDRVLLGSAFADARGAKDRFRAIVETMCRLHGIQDRPSGRSARLLSRPKRKEDVFSGFGIVMLAGEAAGLVSPSSGEGVSFALESGRALGRALARLDPGAAYAGTFAPLADRVTRKLLKARVIGTPWTRRLAMRLPWYP